MLVLGALYKHFAPDEADTTGSLYTFRLSSLILDANTSPIKKPPRGAAKKQAFGPPWSKYQISHPEKG